MPGKQDMGESVFWERSYSGQEVDAIGAEMVTFYKRELLVWIIARALIDGRDMLTGIIGVHVADGPALLAAERIAQAIEEAGLEVSVRAGRPLHRAP